MNTAAIKPAPKPSPTPAVGTEFLHELRNYNAGAVLDELDAAMTQVNKAVQLTGSGGSVTLTYKVGPAGKGLGAKQIAFIVGHKEPKPEVTPAIRFIDEDGHLVKDDPRQKKLAFEPEVVASTATITPVSSLPSAVNQ